MTNAPIGHNGGPPLDPPPDPVEKLRFDLEVGNVDMTVRSRELVDAQKTFPPTIESADQAHRLIALVAQMTNFEKIADGKRKGEKAPHDNLAKAVDGFFKPLIDAVADAKAVAVDQLSAYQRSIARGDDDKATIRTDLGFVASLKDDIDFEIENAEAVPLEYWKIDESAVRAAVKKDVPIPGVRRIASRVSQVR